MKKTSAIIIGISSDIGTALCRKWTGNGWQVTGTYRKKTPAMKKLEKEGACFFFCDVAKPASCIAACRKLEKVCRAWDLLVMLPASLKPIGPFSEDRFSDWQNSVELNFINQMLLVHQLLPLRRRGSLLGPCVLFFSAGGINDAPVNYSAYTAAKIATVKMAELLAEEIKDTRFVTIGPGWVKTKIHQETLAAGSKAGANYRRTADKFKKGNFTPMEKILDCCDWIVNQPKSIVSGRNFHVNHDQWGTKKFSGKLAREPHLLKLRKYGSI